MLGKLHVNSRRPKGPFFPTRSLSLYSNFAIQKKAGKKGHRESKRERGRDRQAEPTHSHTHTQCERVRGPSAIMMRTAIPQMSNTRKIN